ncbi:hypothetical protein ACFVT5_40745 [Streptomyces sp. NPDC058001]|uniref:hypothetical protein n=1 Tax=Streptomyces sp. NPDC058001 TaxID=3346300 RepID=UPI0036E82364
MAHTFDELVEMQRAANEANAQVRQLRDSYGRPTAAPWSDEQTSTYETAWSTWRDRARDVQAAVTEYAKAEGLSRVDRRGGREGRGEDSHRRLRGSVAVCTT